jgi:septum formation protein
MPRTLPPCLILASASPRRRELLWQLGVPHEVQPAGIDERRLPGEGMEQCVQRLAHQKAERVFQAQARSAASRLPVLAADTIVVLGDRLLGKPANRADGLAMLQLLSGKEHRVLTAVALQSHDGISSHLSESRVRFREFGAAECTQYWDTGEPCDKAGAYAIQGYAAAFIGELRGSYSGVMGLPLFETADLLRRAGIAVWQRSAA